MANTSSNPHDLAASTLLAVKAARNRLTARAESKAPRNEAPTPAIDPVTEARLLHSYHHPRSDDLRGWFMTWFDHTRLPRPVDRLARRLN